MARIVSSAVARPPVSRTQEDLCRQLNELLFGPAWDSRTDVADQVQRIRRLFAASGVQTRHLVVDPMSYYASSHSTGQRMVDYQRFGLPLALGALQGCLESNEYFRADAVTDFVVVSCTGYCAPGLDILLAREVNMSVGVRRTVIGHMGCAGAIIGLREALALLRSREQSVVALLSVELSSLHFQETLELGVLTTQALFGDAAAALLLSSHPRARGPQLVDTHCVTDFAALDQMRWTIGDDGFVMGLSTRVPVTVGRNIGPAVQQLLTPHGLAVEDIAHWLVHPGGPSVLEAVQKKLGLSDEMIAPAWDTLRDHGNCSSATVLLMLDRLLRSGEARRGEWGVIMAFGPGLTLETALLRF